MVIYKGTYKDSIDKLTNGVIRCLTDQLNAHITQYATTNNIPIIWWDGIGGTNGDKKQYILDNYYQTPPFGKNKVLCILATRKFAKSATVREFDRKEGKGKYNRLYITEKPIKQYYIYLHDRELGFCCLKISSYMPSLVGFSVMVIISFSNNWRKKVLIIKCMTIPL